MSTMRAITDDVGISRLGSSVSAKRSSHVHPPSIVRITWRPFVV
jgi:hypothetical protein